MSTNDYHKNSFEWETALKNQPIWIVENTTSTNPCGEIYIKQKSYIESVQKSINEYYQNSKKFFSEDNLYQLFLQNFKNNNRKICLNIRFYQISENGNSKFLDGYNRDSDEGDITIDINMQGLKITHLSRSNYDHTNMSIKIPNELDVNRIAIYNLYDKDPDKFLMFILKNGIFTIL